LECQYVVLSTDLDTCWVRATARDEGRWPLERDAFVAVHARFRDLDLPARRVVDAAPAVEPVRDAVLAAYRSGSLVV
jgi:hypothetical protein